MYPQSEAEALEMHQYPYISIVGSLMYLALTTRSDIAYTLESQRTKGTAVRGLSLYSIIISKYYTPAVRGLRLREKVRPTAANINLTKL